MTMRGNIDPVNVLLFGTPEDVEQHVDAIMSKLAGRGRFILGSGCDVPSDTPTANIEALVRAGRRY
jgi:uroporphyrinogen decarboxylase